MTNPTSTKAQAAISALKSFAARIDAREGWAMELTADHIRTLLALVEASEKEKARLITGLKSLQCTTATGARLTLSERFLINDLATPEDAAIDAAISSQGEKS